MRPEFVRVRLCVCVSVGLVFLAITAADGESNMLSEPALRDSCENRLADVDAVVPPEVTDETAHSA